MKHQHLFKFSTYGYAEPPKENIKDQKVWRGQLEVCQCGVRQFRTVDPRLPPVEIITSKGYYGPMK